MKSHRHPRHGDSPAATAKSQRGIAAVIDPLPSLTVRQLNASGRLVPAVPAPVIVNPTRFWGHAGDPGEGLPQYQPTMPPTTKPTGPASNKPDPAPKTAPTLSARELVGARARTIRIWRYSQQSLAHGSSPVRLNVQSNRSSPIRSMRQTRR